MTDINSILTEARKLLGEATSGPCERYLNSSGEWCLRFPRVPRGFNGDCQSFLLCCDISDATLMEFSFNHLGEILDLIDELQNHIGDHGCDIVKLKAKCEAQELELEKAERFVYLAMHSAKLPYVDFRDWLRDSGFKGREALLRGEK